MAALPRDGAAAAAGQRQQILPPGTDLLALVALVVGLLVSILQAATQINEMTLSFIPKILAIFATLLLLGPWMLATLVDYTQRLIMYIPNVIG